MLPEQILYTKQTISQKLHTFAPTLYLIEGAPQWVAKIRTSLNRRTENEKETHEHKNINVVAFFAGLPGVGKFANAAGLMADILHDPEGNHADEPNRISLNNTIDLGFISFAQELDCSRRQKIISSPFGRITPPDEQHRASRQMTEHIIDWLGKPSENPKLLVGEMVAVAYPERDQGASTIIDTRVYAQQRNDTEIYLAEIIGGSVQKNALAGRRALEKIEDPQKANALYRKLRLRLDAPFRTKEDVQEMIRSYGTAEAIIVTTKLVEKKIRAWQRYSLRRSTRITLDAYRDYYEMLAREVFEIYTDHVLVGNNRMLRRRGLDIPFYKQLAKEHTVIL